MVDLDGDNQPDLVGSAYTTTGNLTTSFGAAVGAARGATLLFTPDALPLGSTVDSSLTFSTDGISEFAQIDRFPPYNNLPGGSRGGDHGFQFISHGAKHYGWANIFVEADLGGSASATVYQWAYESDPNAPIAAGAVPEPASVALLVLIAPFLHRPRREQNN